jgi:ABC-2 type transport system ATP-binding protein
MRKYHMAEMIALNGLTKQFGHLLAVDNVTFSVDGGQVLGFLGPNGAGKSTTMKMIAGFLEPTAGTARVAGFDITTSPVEVKRRIGYLPEGAPTYGDMTPASFLDFIAEIRGFDGADKIRRVGEVAERVRLSEVLDQSIDTLSKGYKRRVGLAQAMLHDPDILILDEPTDGLDPNQKHHVRALIHEMAADKAIIVSTHILEEVEAVCSRAIIIARGRVVADGTPEELLAQDPNHNTIVVRTLDQHRAGVEAGLAELGTVSHINGKGPDNGETHLRISAEGAPSLIANISECIRKKGLNVEEVYVERGTLDEVFRQITSDDEAEAVNA